MSIGSTHLRALPVALLTLLACAHAPTQPAVTTAPAAASPAPSPTVRAPNDPPAFVARVSGAGRPVVFLPDLGAPGSVWDTTVAHLGGKVEAHVIDVAGFAGNRPLTVPLMPRLRDELTTYLGDHARGAVLVGHMFGGQMAYWLAMTEPDLVGGVVAIDAPPSRYDGTPDPEVEEAYKGLRSAPAEAFAGGIKHRITSMIADPVLAATIADQIARSSQAEYAEAFHDMMTRDLRAATRGIRAPVLTLLTAGNLPPGALPVAQRYYEEQLRPIAHHELVIVAASKHYVMFDAPEAYFASLDRFLAATAAGK